MTLNTARLELLLVAYADALAKRSTLKPYATQAPMGVAFTDADIGTLVEHMSQMLKRGLTPLGSPALREALKAIGVPYKLAAINKWLGTKASSTKSKAPGAPMTMETKL